MNVIFISGTDTDVGKTYFTGLLAKYLLQSGKKVITQKLVQTGCQNFSEDIIMHRKLMGMELTSDDLDQTTCPYLFSYPASPHLAAEKENEFIDCDLIADKTRQLSRKYDWILLEGAGGLMVPLTSNITILDYIKLQNYPVILVAPAKLGAINHTLLSAEGLKHRQISLLAIAYNLFFSKDALITQDNFIFLQKYLERIPVFEFMDELKISKDSLNKIFETIH